MYEFGATVICSSRIAVFFFSIAFTASVFTVKCISACTFSKAVSSISFITVDSIITVLRFLQVENANGQIAITLSGITIAGKLKQQVNAALPITVTVRGIVTLVKEVQAENTS